MFYFVPAIEPISRGSTAWMRDAPQAGVTFFEGRPGQRPANGCTNAVSETAGGTIKPAPQLGSRSGARGTRTPDLLGAIQALSQLSYSPATRAGFPAYGVNERL